MSQDHRVRSALVAIVGLAALSILRMNGAADAGPPGPSPTPSESPATTTFNVISVGDGLPQGKVGDVIRLPPGVDTAEETLAYLQSLGNPAPSPSPSPSMWPAAAMPPGHISAEEYLESRGIDPEELAREALKGQESVEELIERLATK